MPFKSQAQRRMMWAAKSDPDLREKMGITRAAAEKMTAHDEGGKLPARVPMMKRLARVKRGKRGH